ncbi:MAG: class I SAM-dependent methyltransferase [Phycisphaerales bacterium JB037]
MTGEGSGSLHERAPTTRFAGLAGDYARFRPTYPPAAIDAMLEGLLPELGSSLIAADLGAGTGISSRLLADRGVRVFAVEPNADMRSAAEPHPLVQWVDGTAESTGLAAESVDLCVAAQAMHWFDPERAPAEIRRIVRPGGRIAAVWNLRSTTDAFSNGYQEILEAHGDRAVLERSRRDQDLPPLPSFAEPERLSFEHSQEMDLEAFLGRAASASYTPREGPAREACFTELRAHFERFADARGVARFVYECVVYRAERRAD